MLPPVVVTIEGATTLAEQRTTLLAACREAAAPRACSLLPQTSPESKVSNRQVVHARVIVTGEHSFRIESNSTQGWRSTELEFSSDDEVVEQWRTVGLVIGALAAEKKGARQGSPASASKPNTYRKPSWQPLLTLSTGLAIESVVRREIHKAGFLGLRLDGVVPHFGVAGNVLVTAPEATAQLRSSYVRIEFGPTVKVPVTDPLSARFELLLGGERLDLQWRAPVQDASRSYWQALGLFAIHADLHPLSLDLALTGGLTPEIEVRVDNLAVATRQSLWFGGRLGIGYSW